MFSLRLRDSIVPEEMAISTFPEVKSSGKEYGSSSFVGQKITVVGEGMPIVGDRGPSR